MDAQELGAKLQGIRQDKNLSVEQVSRVLSLRPSIVVAMESGNYREIGALLYAKNYLRKYAKFLGMQDEVFEAELAALSIQSDPKSQGFYETSKVKLEVEEKKRSNNFKYYLIFVLLVLAVFAYLYQSGMIPSPFNEPFSKEEKEGAYLPNERLPSLELEYNFKTNGISNVEDVSFEDLLIDSIKTQQNTMVEDYHGDESLVQSQSAGYKREGDVTELVVLNRENEVNSQDLALPVVNNKQVGTGRFHALGAALRNYAPLLSANRLPLIDLGSKIASRQYVAPNAHIYYFYDTQTSIRFGVESPKRISDKLAKMHRQKTSIYDRESGFYPFIERMISGFRVKGMASRIDDLLHQERELSASLDLLENEERPNSKEIVNIKQTLDKIITEKEALAAKLITASAKLTDKSIVTIVADDITTLDIQDVKGRVIANKVMTSNDEYQLEGQGTYDVYLGNPAVIGKITVNGRAIPEYYYRPLTEEAVSIRFSLNSELYH